MEETKFDVFVGGLSGVFKGVVVEPQNSDKCTVKNIQNLVSITPDDQVTTMAWGDNQENEVLIACGMKGTRSIKVYDSESSSFTSSFCCNVGKGPIVGISRYDEAILTGFESGEIKLWKYKDEDAILIKTDPNMNRMKHSKLQKNIVATGGRNHRLQLYDLETCKKTFTEKNLPHDWLEMTVPIWIADIDFLPGTEQIATCGQYGHVRLYDPKAQRRPVVKLVTDDEPWRTLSVTSREKQIIVGSGKGKMNLVDLRCPGKVLNTYKGFTGSVSSIGCSAQHPYIVSVSLDKFLRVHHMDTKKLLKTCYLTSKLSCMLLRSDFTLRSDDNTQKNDSVITNEEKTKLPSNVQTAESDEEYDQLFEKMQTIGEKAKKRKEPKDREAVDPKLPMKKKKKTQRLNLTNKLKQDNNYS